MPYAVVVSFIIKPEAIADFMPLMLANARTSLAQEEGCLQFDVATNADRAEEVFLYEIYTSRAAFDLHLNTAHFKSFDAAIIDMVTSKEVQTFAQVSQ